MVNIKDKTTGFDLNLATQFIVMFMSMGVMLSQGSFFSFSVCLSPSLSAVSVRIYLLNFSLSSLLQFTVSVSLLTALFPSHPVLPISFWLFCKKIAAVWIANGLSVITILGQLALTVDR